MQSSVAPALETDEELQDLYNWVDEIPLSRPKRNIARDFADGVLFAECLYHFFPKLVEMHNYSAANSHTQKMYNWNTINQKVLKKLGYHIHQQDLDEIIKASPGAVERVLHQLSMKVEQVQNGQLKVGGQGRPSIGRPSSGAEAPLVSAPGPCSSRSHGQDAPAAAAPPSAQMHRLQQEVDTELLLEKEQTIAELQEMVGIMSEKIKKLEQLVKIKDSKIDAMTQKLQRHGIA
eukprot:TRINITY_DN38665_c0_g1_i1.p1 TRINITY_DN38665_c0_g1~~TRINITY_DN38665_c0_g1_i1.p1  ORF type:complete len:233 (-),score=60.44 TRINITY_DN38665_c0_g1_i1:53-751(-)